VRSLVIDEGFEIFLRFYFFAFLEVVGVIQVSKNKKISSQLLTESVSLDSW
jgi:hypothetical protein